MSVITCLLFNRRCLIGEGRGRVRLAAQGVGEGGAFKRSLGKVVPSRPLNLDPVFKRQVYDFATLF